MKNPITEAQFRNYVQQMRILQRFADRTKDPKDRRQARPYERVIDEYLELEETPVPQDGKNQNKEN